MLHNSELFLNDLAEIDSAARPESLLIGIDEVGRGAWAGPMYLAGACVLSPSSYRQITTIQDSKKLSALKREKIYAELQAQILSEKILLELVERDALQISKNGLQISWIDGLNELIFKFVAGFPKRNLKFILDGNTNLTKVLASEFLQNSDLEFSSRVKGDANHYSIAAAAIFAKVSRDKFMTDKSEEFPDYGFEKHVGYGTAAHHAALLKYGITPLHRTNYKPIQEILNG